MRLKNKDKIRLAKELSEKAIRIAEPYWRREEVDNLPGDVLTAEFEGLRIVYSTPFSFKSSEKFYTVAIWTTEMKVFEFHWDPVSIVTFKYGIWMNKIISGSYNSSH